MPAPAVLAGYCRVLVRQHEVAAALEKEPAGTTAWRRLISTENELGTKIAEFCREYFTQPAAPDAGYADPGVRNPFAASAADAGGTPSQIKMLPKRPMPKNYYENPNPPADPRYREVWEQAMAMCAENHPDDPVYAPYRFRARGGD